MSRREQTQQKSGIEGLRVFTPAHELRLIPPFSARLIQP
jgi:hypothetical protein